MVRVIKDNMEKIIALCDKMQLRSLYLFGSGTKEKDFKHDSDLDFLYQFKTDKNGMPVSEYDYFDLMSDLKKITGKNIDLVSTERMENRFFISRVNQEKIKIYEI
jgi:predicted nucleotidyltransferase